MLKKGDNHRGISISKRSPEEKEKQSLKKQESVEKDNARGEKKTVRMEENISEVTQSCPTLCDPIDCSLPGSSVHGILQARILKWVAISFSRGSS